MNKLPLKTKAKILHLLLEGMSMRACSRAENVSFNTIKKLLIDLGRSCLTFHDTVIRNIKSKRIECDEIHTFVGCRGLNATPEKEEKGLGVCWTFTAIDCHTKLIISWMCGKRQQEVTDAFISDLAERLASKVQLSTDGFPSYISAIHKAFPTEECIDYGQLVKQYDRKEKNGKVDKRKQYVGAIKRKIFGNPNPKYISTKLCRTTKFDNENAYETPH